MAGLTASLSKKTCQPWDEEGFCVTLTFQAKVSVLKFSHPRKTVPELVLCTCHKAKGWRELDRTQSLPTDMPHPGRRAGDHRSPPLLLKKDGTLLGRYTK